MLVIVLTLATAVLSVLCLYAYRRLSEMKAERMSELEYNTAVTVWQYAKLVKEQLDLTARRGSMVLDYSTIKVPHSPGYKVSLELVGPRFRIYATPEKHNRTGRLSFYSDETLSVRAADLSGRAAGASDPEYAGTPSP